MGFSWVAATESAARGAAALVWAPAGHEVSVEVSGRPAPESSAAAILRGVAACLAVHEVAPVSVNEAQGSSGLGECRMGAAHVEPVLEAGWVSGVHSVASAV